MKEPAKRLPQPVAGLDQFRANKGVLACPSCGKLIPLVGKREVIRHPVAQRLQDRSFAITGWWTLFLLVCFFLSVLVAGGDFMTRSFGFALFILPAVPSFVIYFVVRFYPIYRVTKCPYCKFEDLQKLGRWTTT